jgi:hypothetical protein
MSLQITMAGKDMQQSTMMLEITTDGHMPP